VWEMLEKDINSFKSLIKNWEKRLTSIDKKENTKHKYKKPKEEIKNKGSNFCTVKRIIIENQVWE